MIVENVIGDILKRINRISNFCPFLILILLTLVPSSLVFTNSSSIATTVSYNPKRPKVHLNEIFDPYEWNVSTPEEYGLDAGMLANAYQEASKMPFLYSFLVIRDGTLIVEWYFNGADKNASYTVHSASKSFMSALIGIALRENYLSSLDQKLLDFFPEYITSNLDPRKFNITLKHLLTMKAGFRFYETADDWIPYWTSPDWVKYAIELPLMHNPGEDWHYSTPQTNLLSAILTKATNISTREFAEQYLFNPLQISIRHWHQDPQGYYTGGHEMFFTPRDMARFGYLYLNNGLIDGEQIIPAEWIEESLQDYSGGLHGSVGYGYKWWLEKIGNNHTFSARGLGGQYIVNFPELNMIVVTTASGSIFDIYPNQTDLIMDLIEEHILPTVKKITPVTSKSTDTVQSTNTGATQGFELLPALIVIFVIFVVRNKEKGKMS